ncbi:MAG: ChaB family protein [Firmicutes bacterium]|uniref:ChaB protein n=1 Tax=Melghirimyces thermohalophilus TaxID=1236220 RepID=A0A1G6NTX8_9BACL|nr:ChaB family protein [Melghirimyces thermohalophilus]MDA8351617.1 ChaB family protein [Bacillota bacterium]SDC70615.1 ChaB protein [Melghirimyces thermohalophilus]
MSQDTEELKLHNHVTAHLSKRAAAIYSWAYQLIWVHMTDELAERETIAHQVAWDRLKDEYLNRSSRLSNLKSGL